MNNNSDPHINFSGFDDWVPIFAGGKQIDSHGIEHDADGMIDKAIQLFDPEYHEPPLTVGHPEDNSPAFGWVKALRKVTQKIKDGSKVNVLMAKFKDVVPEFAQAVRQGLYRKRSASFYPDGRLRHVGFLGGMPPAVKGLADLKFEENDRCMIFSDALGLEAVLNLNYTEEKEGQMSDDAHRPYTEEHLQALLEQQRERFTAEFEEKLQKSMVELTERLNQVNQESARKIEDAREEGRREAAADFAEQRQKDAESARKKEISEFITSGIQSGQILPAWEKLGLTQFMEGLGVEQTFNFAEGKKETQYQWFRNLLAELPKTVNFSEFATRAKNVAATGNAGQQLNDLVASKMKDNSKLSYMSAFSEVQRENPDLVREYEQEIHLAR